MKRFAVLLLSALAAAGPAAELLTRQISSGSTANELERGPCKGATFIWARGTMEPGNMGWIIGNYLGAPLKRGLRNDIAIQGVKYSAGILTNIGPGMADPKGVAEAQRLFKLAVQKCPKTIITGGGYSQGAAIMHRAIEKLPEDIKSHIAAILLYGDTQYPVDGPRIKGFPPEKVKTICKPNDGVCKGMITVSAGHMSYSSYASEGATWLVQKIKAAKKNPTRTQPKKAQSTPKKPAPKKAEPKKAEPKKVEEKVEEKAEEKVEEKVEEKAEEKVEAPPEVEVEESYLDIKNEPELRALDQLWAQL